MVDVRIVVCGHVPAPGAGAVVPPWCDRPGEVADLLRSADRVVLAACPDGPDLPAVQRLAARAGLGPTDVDYLRLDPDSDSAVLLTAAAARLAVDTPCGPVGEERPTAVSRRALLRLEAPLRFPLPATTGPCPGGCSVCVRACPAAAIARDGETVSVDPDRCTGCGLCVGACPTGALADPAATAARVETHVAALLEGPTRALAYACRHRLPASLPPGWAALPVGGLGAIRVAWLLAPLLRGAAAVTVLGCDACPSLTDRIDVSRGILAAAGADPGRVLSGTPADLPPAALPRRDVEDPFGPFGAAAVAAALAPAERADLAHPAAPLGRVTIGDRCTASFMCVSVCPTGALVIRDEGPDRIVELHPERCVACGACLAACPEGGRGALDLVPAVSLPFRVRELRRHRGRPCPHCGTFTYEGPMRARVAELLAGELDTADECESCRSGVVDAFARAVERGGR